MCCVVIYKWVELTELYYDLKSKYDLGVVCIIFVQIYSSVNGIQNLKEFAGRTAIKPRSNSLSLLDKTVQEQVHSLPAREGTCSILTSWCHYCSLYSIKKSDIKKSNFYLL